MTKKLNAAFKEQLLAQRASLMAQLRDLRGGAVGRAEASAEHFGQKEDSTAQDNSARALEFALDAHDSEELDRLDAALRRIEDGSYGLCVDCGVGIPAARLHAAPDALRCIACQEKFEERQAQRS
ncbi:MAG: TraR/DksA family transcriptional regulator [Rhodoferax sp.]|uniref:TraR/DksA family transcriptional regulator n=1 Tax=Rhodoferax sp. TaxID=50421 RepID=UPI0013FF3670|nr:TraR/DksA family transcriptional regulator [Rhodoferax sp.]NDP40024.1 TraR/DksA family transcriptional regulator [Rhodoferax sp.]